MAAYLFIKTRITDPARYERYVEAMRALNRNGIISGESGSAALAGASAMARAGRLAAPGKADSLVLLSTEGITDPDFYAREVAGR